MPRKSISEDFKEWFKDVMDHEHGEKLQSLEGNKVWTDGDPDHPMFGKNKILEDLKERGRINGKP